MTLTFKRNLDGVKMNQHARYLGQRSFYSKVIVQTHRALTTKVVGKNCYDANPRQLNHRNNVCNK